MVTKHETIITSCRKTKKGGGMLRLLMKLTVQVNGIYNFQSTKSTRVPFILAQRIIIILAARENELLENFVVYCTISSSVVRCNVIAIPLLWAPLYNPATVYALRYLVLAIKTLLYSFPTPLCSAYTDFNLFTLSLYLSLSLFFSLYLSFFVVLYY
jgi:hypothetical protein